MAGVSDSQDPLEKFGVLLPERAASEWPVFLKIVEKLCSHGKEANSDERAVLNAKTTYSMQRTSLLQLKILQLTIVQALAYNSQKKFSAQVVQCKCCLHTEKERECLKNYLLLGLSDLNSVSGKGMHQPFGVNREFFSQHFQVANIELMKTILREEVIGGISKLSKSVLSFYNQDYQEKLLFAKMNKFPDVLDEDMKNVKRLESDIWTEKMQYLKKTGHYYQLLNEAVALFSKKCEQMKVDERNLTSISKFYVMKANALSMKTKLLKLQILNDTYSRETVPVLKLFWRDLLVKEENVEQQLLKESTVLQNYEKVGGIFPDLVKEYSTLLARIKQEEWAFEELKKSEENK